MARAPLARPLVAHQTLLHKAPAARMSTAGEKAYKGKVVKLNTDQALPQIGLGTFQDPDEQEMSVYTALTCGFRHIDTAHKSVFVGP